MSSVNKVILMGRLGGDPEIIENEDPKRKKVKFSLATSVKYRDSIGEVRERVSWHHVVGYGYIVGLFDKITVKKGNLVYIEGSLNYKQWSDAETGLKHYMTEVIMSKLLVVNSGSNGYMNAYAYKTANTDADKEPIADDSYIDDGSEPIDDLPF